jgi:uncharacterized membrane protein YgcG
MMLASACLARSHKRFLARIASSTAFLFLLTAIIVSTGTHPAYAQAPDSIERITAFSSDITIGRDGTLTVRETISVNAQRNRIQRGIFRDFPTVYGDDLGNRYRVGFDVQSVTRNGQEENFVLENIANGRRVRIGNADVFLTPGIHDYTIVYTTNRQIGFFEDYDSLYWNVTGNGWEFAIDYAEAVIRLPGENLEEFEVYTGPEGASGRDATATRLSADTVRFATTRRLGPGEGLTVAVSFPKGIVAPPTAVDRANDFLRDNGAVGAALIGFLALFAYYFYVWSKVGRDPAPGVVVPLFAPPEGFSAAATRYVHRMGYDRKAFAAAIVSMAVKGYLNISEAGGDFTLSRTGMSVDETNLAKGERSIAQALFAGRDEIELKNKNHQTVSRAISRLQDALRNEDEEAYFVTNSGWFYLGLLILVASAALAVMLSADPAAAAGIGLWISVWATGTSFLVYRTIEKWRGVSIAGGSRIVNFAGAVFATLFAFPFVGFLFGALTLLGDALSFGASLGLIAQGILAFVFYRLLKAPTKAGAKVRSEIEGFKMFLTTAEKDRLEVLHPPHVTPEIFEKFLPYAIALDSENAWSKKFEAEIAEAGMEKHRSSYSPRWYSGRSFDRLGTSGFASSIGGAVAGATAAAARAPGSSSGMGGGGSSGGGGGGGGGGGW